MFPITVGSAFLVALLKLDVTTLICLLLMSKKNMPSLEDIDMLYIHPKRIKRM